VWSRHAIDRRQCRDAEPGDALVRDRVRDAAAARTPAARLVHAHAAARLVLA